MSRTRRARKATPLEGHLTQPLLFEDFEGHEHGAAWKADWWVEGGERVWIESGHLHMKADPPGERDRGYVCTVWHKRPFGGDLRVQFDAHVVASSVDANNINFFLFYSDPRGTPLFATRTERADAAYPHYHKLNGYIFTFLNDTQGEGGRAPDGTPKARFRMRRCPGFRLVDEAYDYHCRKGLTYHVTVTRQEGRLTYAVDGQVFLRWNDDEPLSEGHIGLRTFRTDLWWDNIQVERLD